MPGLKIIIIDDEEHIQELFKLYLEEQGHEVAVYSEPLLCDVYQGCNCQKNNSCSDLIIVDYNMPRMTGLEFLETLHGRGCKASPENKFILSGNTNEIDMERVRRIRCRVIQKPISLFELDRIVQGVAERLAKD